jgi:hypothetical protein
VASKPTTVSLITGAAGIVGQILSGVAKYPKSPGRRHLLAVALLVSLLPCRYTPVVDVALVILILVRAFVAPGMGNRLTKLGETGPFIDTLVQTLA